MESAIGYVVTLAAAACGLTQLPNIVTGLLLARITSPVFSQLVGALLSWTVIATLWERWTGHMIPIALLAGCIGFSVFHLKVASAQLTMPAKSGMLMEMVAIVGVGVWKAIEAPVIRWF